MKVRIEYHWSDGTHLAIIDEGDDFTDGGHGPGDGEFERLKVEATPIEEHPFCYVAGFARAPLNGIVVYMLPETPAES